MADIPNLSERLSIWIWTPENGQWCVSYVLISQTEWLNYKNIRIEAYRPSIYRFDPFELISLRYLHHSPYVDFTNRVKTVTHKMIIQKIILLVFHRNHDDHSIYNCNMSVATLTVNYSYGDLINLARYNRNPDQYYLDIVGRYWFAIRRLNSWQYFDRLPQINIPNLVNRPILRATHVFAYSGWILIFQTILHYIYIYIYIYICIYIYINRRVGWRTGLHRKPLSVIIWFMKIGGQ